MRVEVCIMDASGIERSISLDLRGLSQEEIKSRGDIISHAVLAFDKIVACNKNK